MGSAEDQFPLYCVNEDGTVGPVFSVEEVDALLWAMDRSGHAVGDLYAPFASARSKLLNQAERECA